MPWKETCPMDERLAFIADHRRDQGTMSALCEAYGAKCHSLSVT